MEENAFRKAVQEFPFLQRILQSMPGGRSPAAGIDSVSVRLGDENLMEVAPFRVHYCCHRQFGDYVRERVFWVVDKTDWFVKLAFVGRSTIHGAQEIYSTALPIGAQLFAQAVNIAYLVEVSYECVPKFARKEKVCQRRVIVYKMADFDWRTSCRYMLLDAA